MYYAYMIVREIATVRSRGDQVVAVAALAVGTGFSKKRKTNECGKPSTGRDDYRIIPIQM